MAKYHNTAAEIRKCVSYPIPDSMECWKYTFYPQQKVKLLHRKNCYPNPGSKQFLKILNFDQCKVLYTKCDYRLERCVHECILKLEDQFRAHFALVEQEMDKQNKLLDDMWIQSQRFLLLTQSGICVKQYPEIISVSTEKRALCRFHRNLKIVNNSNCLLSTSLEKIRTSRTEFNNRYVQLDLRVESPFILGTYYLKSLHYIRNILEDLFHYFYSHLCKLKCWAQFLDPGDSIAIEDYMALIKPNKEYENNLKVYLDNCFCLRRRRKECIKPHVTC